MTGVGWSAPQPDVNMATEKNVAKIVSVSFVRERLKIRPFVEGPKAGRFIMEDLFVNNRLTIPASQLQTSFSRSGGPGGQNVNKVSSKVTLRWHVDDQPLLAPGWRSRLWAHYGNRITREGDLVIHSDRYRDQPRNITDCRARLVEMLLSCAAPPVARKNTVPTAASQRRRVADKRKRAEKKSGRRDPGME
jgi:ribosome-associated protein